MPPHSQATDYQSRLAWACSAYAGLFAFAYSIAVFSPESGLPFAALAGVTAFLCAQIAGKTAGYFGRSRYGFIACAITVVLFSLVPSAAIIFYLTVDYLQTGIETPETTIRDYTKLIVLYFAIGLRYFAAPAALVATLIFHLALFVIRKQQWLAFQQRWI